MTLNVSAKRLIELGIVEMKTLGSSMVREAPKERCILVQPAGVDEGALVGGG